MRNCRILGVACLVWVACPAFGQGVPLEAPRSGVRIDWDAYGVPHISARSDEDAFFGLGFATAKDRLFQLHYNRIAIQGRTAEFFGPGEVGGNVKQDRIARQIGWARHAQKVVATLDRRTRGLLAAYADGVNAYALRPGARLHPLFGVHGVPVQRWQPEDCIAVWLRLGRHFSGFANNEAERRHTLEDLIALGVEREEILSEILGDAMCVDRHAVVKQEDVSTAKQRSMAEFAQRMGVPQHLGCTQGVYVPKFSQALAVSGQRTTSGRAVLLGEPRVNVYFPNMFYEWHVKGETFDVRGVGVAGSPNLLVGSNANVAWSPTAMGLDQADLFKLEVDATGHPGQYLVDGRWLPYAVDESELILVKGGATVVEIYRETTWGPVVRGPVIKDVRPGEVYAVKAVPLANPERDALVGFLNMYRATDLSQFARALDGWTWPSANVVFAASDGGIGYAAVGDAPIRKANEALAGIIALDGNTKQNDWQGYLPHALRPMTINPRSGAVFSANHLPIGSWYPLRSLYPGLGAGARARRIGELLVSKRVFSEDDVKAMHLDRVNPNTRDVVALGLVIRDRMRVTLSRDARTALEIMEGWLQAGATLDRKHGGVAVASNIRGTLRRTPDGNLVDTWGSGASGLTNMLEERMRGLTLTPPVVPTREDIFAIDGLLSEALGKLYLAEPRLQGASSGVLGSWYLDNVLTGELPRWTALGQRSPLDRGTVSYGPLVAAHKETNLSQIADSYTQFVVLGKRDGAQSMLAFGQSEHDGDPHTLDQQRLWESGGLKPSPMTSRGLQRLGVERTLILQRR